MVNYAECGGKVIRVSSRRVGIVAASRTLPLSHANVDREMFRRCNDMRTMEPRCSVPTQYGHIHGQSIMGNASRRTLTDPELTVSVIWLHAAGQPAAIDSCYRKPFCYQSVPGQSGRWSDKLCRWARVPAAAAIRDIDNIRRTFPARFEYVSGLGFTKNIDRGLSHVHLEADVNYMSAVKVMAAIMWEKCETSIVCVNIETFDRSESSMNNKLISMKNGNLARPVTEELFSVEPNELSFADDIEKSENVEGRCAVSLFEEWRATLPATILAEIGHLLPYVAMRSDAFKVFSEKRYSLAVHRRILGCSFMHKRSTYAFYAGAPKINEFPETGGTRGTPIFWRMRAALPLTFSTAENLLQLLMSLCMLCVGLWAEFRLQRYFDLSPEFSGTANFIVISISCFLVGINVFFLNCLFGTNTLMLMIYAAFMTVIFMMNIGIAVALFSYWHTFGKSLHDGLTQTIVTGDPHKVNFDVAQHYVSNRSGDFHCCGVYNYTDWMRLSPHKVIPISCCIDPNNCVTANYSDVYQRGYSPPEPCGCGISPQTMATWHLAAAQRALPPAQGCYDMIVEFLQTNRDGLLIAGCGAVIMPIFGIALTICLVSHLKKPVERVI
ncbi:unnamed protein product [Chrysodeixis includens]|uniref:Tetraspanin n=1 Tax=Chrysodeixis includens TaxID=689277 RepID=A0A9N8KUI3_CHRIL|nr:unnamed protein product [Chrysodeixis includens]